MTADQLDPEESRRLATWVGAIAVYLRPDAPVAYTADGLRIGLKGGLSIAADGQWYDHEAGKGGPNALSLIAHVRQCKPAGAVMWARTWLAEHPGDGEPNAEGAAEAAAEARGRRAAYAQQILDEASDPAGTPAATSYALAALSRRTRRACAGCRTRGSAKARWSAS